MKEVFSRRIDMIELIGLFMILSAATLLTVFILGYDLETKDKIQLMILIEVFLFIMISGVYLMLCC